LVIKFAITALDLASIDVDVRQIRRHVDLEVKTARFNLKAKRVHRLGEEGRRTRRHQLRRHGTRFDLRQVEQFPHQPVEARRVLAAHLQNLLLPLVQRTGRAFEQEMDAHLHAGQRRPAVRATRRQ
jgi:hypothetical protein